MKKNHFFMMIVLFLSMALFYGCAGDGKDGADGTIGTNGTNGTNGADGPAGTADYLGRSFDGMADCVSCHPAYGDKWRQSGHAFKINKIEDGAIPLYPFSDISAMFPQDGYTITFDADGTVENTVMTVSNTSYLIGGFGWKARYMDSKGYKRHGKNAQYNLATGAWSGYNNSAGKGGATGVGDATYNCGYCHVTGWDTTSALDEGALPGITGDWKFGSIACERCHGSNTGGGTGHNPKLRGADGGDATTHIIPDMEGKSVYNEFSQLSATHVANTVCADCHVRSITDTSHAAQTTVFTTKLPLSSGLIQHHQQAQELYAGGKRASHGCVDCHDPHASTKYDSQARGEGVKSSKIVSGNCSVSCHSTKTISSTYKTNHTCVNCHMPYISKSAVDYTTAAKAVTGVSALGIPLGKRGDLKTHIFSLTKGTNDTFLSGSALDSTAASVKIPVDFSCMTCHGTGGTKGPTTAAEANTILTSTPVH